MKKRRLKRQANLQAVKQESKQDKLQDVNELIKELDNDLESLYLMSIDIEKQWEDFTIALEDYKDFLLSIDI